MSGQSDPNSDKSAYTLLWALAGIFILGFLIWHFFKLQLITAFIVIKKYEAMALGFFISGMDPAITWLDSAIAQEISLPVAARISEYIGSYLMYPAIVLLILMATYLLKSHTHVRYNKTHSINTLASQEQKNWPQISPVVGLDLVSEDVNKGPWAMMMNPMQFAKAYQLLQVEKIPDRKALWLGEGTLKATVIKARALRVFAGQLGPIWPGVDNLPPHVKALYGVFLARIEHQIDEAREFLAKLAISAAKSEIDYSGTDALIKKYGDSKAAKRCLSIHAYITTVMAAMIELCRVDGVLASADFLWLKPIDRRLWYMLNTVGRQVVPSEIAGAFAHWIFEKKMNKSLNSPMVDEAVIGLDKAINRMVYIPDEEENIDPSLVPDANENEG